MLLKTSGRISKETLGTLRQINAGTLEVVPGWTSGGIIGEVYQKGEKELQKKLHKKIAEGYKPQRSLQKLKKFNN